MPCEQFVEGFEFFPRFSPRGKLKNDVEIAHKAVVLNFPLAALQF